MTDFGRYRLCYEPAPYDPCSGVLDHTVEMTVSGEANLSQLSSLFDSFLKAVGFVYDGELKISSPEDSNSDFWKEKYVDLMKVIE